MYKVNLMDDEIAVEQGRKVIDEIKKYADEDDDIKNIIACKVNQRIKSLYYEIQEDCSIKYIYTNSLEGMRLYVKGLVFILMKAVDDLYPKCKVEVNYALGDALFCKINNLDIIDENIVKIRRRMKEIIDEDIPIVKRKLSAEEVKDIYMAEGYNEKLGIINEKGNTALSLYYLEETHGYFYGKMPISTSYMKKYDLKKYEYGVVLMYPSKNNSNIILSSNMPKKLYNTFFEYEDFYKTLGIKNIADLNKYIKDGEIGNVIRISEAMHEKKIANIADKIVRDANRPVVLIAGPSSSGKTTFAQRLGIQLAVNKTKYVTISMDNYFVDREYTPLDENGDYDFESLKAVDVELLNKNINSLLNGEEIKLPLFDFKTGVRQYSEKKYKLNKNDIIILEGIHALNDELTYTIPIEKKFKIFVSALTVLNVDTFNRISTSDSRLIRRIIRDSLFRNYPIEGTMLRWESVRKGEDKYIFPYQENADVMFNTSLPYEFALFKELIEKELKKIPDTSDYYSETNRLYTLLEMFLPLESGVIPVNSILREFIGDGCFYR